MSKFCLVLLIASSLMAGLLLMHLWPFSRTAVLIPLAWWAMYAINKWRVSMPVFGLIDEAAEKAGFIPLAGKVTAPSRVLTEQEQEKAELKKNTSVVLDPSTAVESGVVV